MKLWYDKKSKDPAYFVQIGVRNGKKVTSKNIHRIGKHSELLADGHADPLEYAKKVVEEYTKKKDDGKLDISFNVDFNQKLTHCDNIASNSTNFNIGYFYLQDIYSKLGIKEFLNDVTKNSKIKFDLNEITRFFIFDRILNPRSKLATIKNLNFFYEKPIFSHQQGLRGMNVLYDNYDKYLENLYIKSNEIINRDTSVCYYDCTNFYFETETSDDVAYDELTGEVIYGLRQYGPSKEHRPNPIVEMGLFMDKDGIPLTIGIYSGNTNEQKTAPEVERKLLKSLKNKKIIYCADAGLGSAAIRALNDMGGRAFIVTQSIKKLSTELQNELLKDSGYKLLSNDKDIKLSELKNFDKNKKENFNLYQDKAYKWALVDSNIDLGLFEEKTLKNGKTKKVKSTAKLKQKIIITYSRKMAEYQKSIREKQIERAKILLKRGVDDIRRGPNDVSRFIKTADESKKTYILDEERIANEEKYDGFYAIATNLLEDKVKDVLGITEQRYKIEECFRILKTNFGARPVFHSLDFRIVAHFMICYTALLIYKILEKKLMDKNYHFTINDIITTLKNMNVSNREDLYYETTFTASQVCTALNDTFDLGLDKKYYKNNELGKKVKKFFKD